MRTLISLLLTLLVSACAVAPVPPASQAEYGSDICSYEAGHYAPDGTYVEAVYYCPPSSPRAGYAPNSCTWVDGYSRSDGTYVSAHFRCKNNLSPSTASYGASGSTTSTAPCVTSYCGPVSVKGYYRKDGTYVRPHTRSRSRR